MCTTYTWLAFPWPDRARASPRASASTTSAMTADDVVVVVGRRPQICRPHVHRHHLQHGLPRRRRARHWMGLAIVGVQMAAWCLVGALLMHRGVTNLKRRDGVQAARVATTTPDSASEPTTTTTSTPTSWSSSSSPSLEQQEPATTVTDLLGVRDDNADAADGDKYLPPPRVDLRDKSSAFLPGGSHIGVPLAATSSPSSAFIPFTGSGKVPPVTPGTGAATAVVMTTVGAVMLVVGPAFMFIKIMDVYQRQKRLAKLSLQQDDPPPSYDEVAEKAPRYSALFQLMESGELTPLSIVEPGPGCAGTSSATSGGRQDGQDADDGGEGQITNEAKEEEEADASTPLRPASRAGAELQSSCSDKDSRRRSV